MIDLTVSERARLAREYRDIRQYPGGFVMFYGSEITGWSKEFPRSEAYVPGVIAIDAIGTEWVATGGDDYDGAEKWEQVK